MEHTSKRDRTWFSAGSASWHTEGNVVDNGNTTNSDGDEDNGKPTSAWQKQHRQCMETLMIQLGLIEQFQKFTIGLIPASLVHAISYEKGIDVAMHFEPVHADDGIITEYAMRSFEPINSQQTHTTTTRKRRMREEIQPQHTPLVTCPRGMLMQCVADMVQPAFFLGPSTRRKQLLLTMDKERSGCSSSCDGLRLALSCQYRWYWVSHSNA